MEPGRYKATIGARGVAPNKNGIATFSCEYWVYAVWDGEQWVSVPQERITAWHYLEKRSGELNESTIGQLRDALGWDGLDPFWLQDADLPDDFVVQLSIDDEEYQGRVRSRVKWLAAADADPGAGPGLVERAEGAARSQLAARLGPKLRAIAGGTPAPAPTPKPSAALPAAAAPPPPVPAAKWTKERAWTEVCEAAPAAMDGEKIAARWAAQLDKRFPGKGDNDMTSDDWRVLADRFWVPTGDDVPF